MLEKIKNQPTPSQKLETYENLAQKLTPEELQKLIQHWLEHKERAETALRTANENLNYLYFALKKQELENLKNK